MYPERPKSCKIDFLNKIETFIISDILLSMLFLCHFFVLINDEI